MKPVAKVDRRTGEIVHQYKSVSDAARRNGCHVSNICHSLRGRHYAAGYEWIYIDKHIVAAVREPG